MLGGFFLRNWEMGNNNPLAGQKPKMQAENKGLAGRVVRRRDVPAVQRMDAEPS